MASTPQHWDTAYAQGDTTRGWYQAEAHVSMRLLRDAGVTPADSVVDIGGGASVFVDGLVDAGFTDVTILDHSAIGLGIAQQRLGARSSSVTWVESDLLLWRPERTFDVWHDRAVLHFLLEPAQQRDYAKVLHRATHAGSVVIIGVFGLTGPQMCSGLPVHRYDAAQLEALLGPDFAPLAKLDDVHVKPDGSTQDYLWWAGRRTSSPAP